MFNTLRWLHTKTLLKQSRKIYVTFEQYQWIRQSVRDLTSSVKRLEKTTMPFSTAVEEISEGLINQKQGTKFTDYDCLGFDLDNTVCRYKIGSMIKLEYETMAKFLVDKRGYPSDHLMKPIENNLDFMLKGLILDVENGNVLRIAPDGHILHGSHGTKELRKEDLIKYYGVDCRWEATDKFSCDPLYTWNGPYSEQMRTLLDYFDMPAGLIFARVVDTLDEKNGGPMKSYSIWPDLLDALQDMFDKQHFQLNKGGYFNEIKANPDYYIHKCSDELINWFKALRKHNKLLFLITGSNIDFASHTATNSLGPNWKELFDIIICFAKKPGFFISNRPFVGINGFEETGPVSETDLERGGIYTYGNWNGLYQFLKKHSQREIPKIVYVGDNLVQDVYTPAVHANCDTIAVCEELEAEGAFGHDPVHVDQEFLVSSTWGSYFLHKDEERHTIWRDIINKHSKACIPSLEYVAAKPLHQEYFPIHL